VDNAAQDAAIVDPPRAWLPFRQQGFEHGPLPIVEPKLARHHSSSTVLKLESR
jgi:hypothetical protein